MNALASRYIPKEVRQAVIRRDRRCFYCTTEFGPFEFDHFTPHSQGGGNDAANVVLACMDCNRRKGAKDYGSFMRAEARALSIKAQRLHAIADALNPTASEAA